SLGRTLALALAGAGIRDLLNDLDGIDGLLDDLNGRLGAKVGSRGDFQDLVADDFDRVFPAPLGLAAVQFHPGPGGRGAALLTGGWFGGDVGVGQHGGRGRAAGDARRRPALRRLGGRLRGGGRGGGRRRRSPRLGRRFSGQFRGGPR